MEDIVEVEVAILMDEAEGEIILIFFTYCGRNNHAVDTRYHKHGFPLGYKFKQGATKSAHTVASINAKKDVTPFEANFPNFNIQISQEQYNSLMVLIQQSSC